MLEISAVLMRKYDIFFQYPWSEQDTIEIALPKGFALDNADAPGLLADPSKIGSLNVYIGVDTASNTLIYKRQFLSAAAEMKKTFGRY